MFPSLISVKPLKPLTLELEYDNGEKRIIDLSGFCISPFFKQLEDWEYFKKVRVSGDVVVWPNQQDIAPETLYLDSKRIN
ncbi:MAG: DUF2442 domain-containing protein [Candidatus Kapaibacterium sp.]